METIGFVTILVCILLAALISRRVQNTIVTMPMVYTTMGLLIGPLFFNLVDIDPRSHGLQLVAELTLVIVLANDAARIDIQRLFRDHSLPQRLLGIGLPLTMVLGALIAALLFPEISFIEAVILAIVLTPTDASLGQSVVSNPKVPVRIRQALNIESGLNDGIALPFLLLAIGIALDLEVAIGSGRFVIEVITDMLIGGLVGVALGYIGCRAIRWGIKSKWMSSRFQKISALALVLLAFSAAAILGGNGYIAAFLFGLTFGNTFGRRESENLIDFSEMQVDLLMLVTFLLFGAVMLPHALEQLNLAIVGFSVLSLTVMRMLPVWISMVRAKIHPVTTLFLGWFGPRGIASILYVFTVLEAEYLPAEKVIYSAGMITVLLSVFAHGITAAPLSNRYGARMSELKQVALAPVENEDVSEMPLRTGAN
ncbi:MAG: cation:proton antiporter [Anaerolineales bacterium]|jgi:NhaP-type Na+/H+ or K+/H+ antiporter